MDEDGVNMMDISPDTDKQQLRKGNGKTCLVDRYDDKLSRWIRDTQKTRRSRVQAVCDACRNNNTNTKQCRELILDEKTLNNPEHYKPHLLVDDEHEVNNNSGFQISYNSPITLHSTDVSTQQHMQNNNACHA